MEATHIKYRSRVMVTRPLPTPGPPLTGIAVARYFSPTGEAIFSVILDAPTGIGVVHVGVCGVRVSGTSRHTSLCACW